MEQIDVLWLIEHVAREMDVACAVSAILQKKIGISIKIRHVHLTRHTDEFEPKLIIYPFFYGLNTGAGRFFQRWPQKKHLNLNWEQIYYSGVAKLKKPQDEIAKKYVLHSVWGEFYKQYLLKFGVTEKNIFVNGNPAYQLYLSPYRQYYQNREQLSIKYKLNSNKRWIFIPENYRWAFNSDQEIKNKQKLGGDLEEMLKIKDYCRKSLKLLLQWCLETAQQNNDFIILFRPKPITALSIMINFFKSEVSKKIPRNLIFTKNESVREWILASDIIISSFSTTLIEACMAGKPLAMVEPIPLLESLKNEWYNLIPTIKTQKKFENLCSSLPDGTQSTKLHSWAISEMLNTGDAISNLTQTIKNLLDNKISISTFKQNDIVTDLDQSVLKRFPKFIKHSFKNLSGLISGHTEKKFHENDLFNNHDVLERIKKWDLIL